MLLITTITIIPLRGSVLYDKHFLCFVVSSIEGCDYLGRGHRRINRLILPLLLTPPDLLQRPLFFSLSLSRYLFLSLSPPPLLSLSLSLSLSSPLTPSLSLCRSLALLLPSSIILCILLQYYTQYCGTSLRRNTESKADEDLSLRNRIFPNGRN